MNLIQTKKTLSVGIILDSFDVPKWIEKTISNIIHTGCVEITVILGNSNDSPQKNKEVVLEIFSIKNIVSLIINIIAQRLKKTLLK
jgi:hypothetical protein